MTATIREPMASEPGCDTAVTLKTKWADVSVYGHHLMSPKDIEVLHACLTAKEWDNSDHGVRVVVFRDDNFPREEKTGKSVLANCTFDSRAMAINLSYHWQRAMRAAVLSPARCIHSVWHQLLIETYFHEMAHLAPRVNALDRVNMDSQDQALEDEHAEAFAFGALLDLAKNVNIEPDLWSEGPFFRLKVNSMLTRTMGEEDELEDVDGWFNDQEWMLDNHVFFSLKAVPGETHPVTYASFKRFCECIAPEDDGGWNKNTLGTLEEPALNEKLLQEEADRVYDTLMAKGVDEEALIEEALGDKLDDYKPPVDTEMAKAITQIFGMTDLTMDQKATMVAALTNNASMDAIQTLMDTPVETVTVPNTGGAQKLAAPASEAIIDVEPTPREGDFGMYMDFIDEECGVEPTPKYEGEATTPASTTPPTQPEPTEGFMTGLAPSETQAESPQVNRKLKPTGLDAAQTDLILRTIYRKVYDFLFSECQPCHQEGPKVAFKWAEGAISQYIPLTEQEKLVCFKMDHHDMNGRWCPEVPTTKGLLGQTNEGILKRNNKAVNKDELLPEYKLYFNFCGTEICRSLKPQNPSNRKVWGDPTSPYQDSAIRAQKGAHIMHIMEGDKDVKKAMAAAAKQNGTKYTPWKNKIEDGEFHS